MSDLVTDDNLNKTSTMVRYSELQEYEGSEEEKNTLWTLHELAEHKEPVKSALESPPEPADIELPKVVDDAEIQDEIQKFYESFDNLRDNFELLDKIGAGTFSSVYKAIDLRYNDFVNDWEYSEGKKIIYDPAKEASIFKFVAIKRIYVTSSASRIMNELKILKDLDGLPNIAPLITAMRCNDQVVAVVPYFENTDFRQFYQTASIPDIQVYFRQLMNALKFVHSKDIIHRDIKPHNFLFDINKKTGLLIDFGLAETSHRSGKRCDCRSWTPYTVSKKATNIQGAIPKNDSRPGKRTNRAGTRGFRAPEVLFKCHDQSTKLDIWSAGVILMCFLTKRFPFFNSTDDVEATLELATIFGKKKMEECALLHGSVFETNITSIKDNPIQLDVLVEWCLTGYKPRREEAITAQRARAQMRKKGEKGPFKNPALRPDELEAVEFMKTLLEPNYHLRLSAEEALQHPFLAEPEEI